MKKIVFLFFFAFFILFLRNCGIKDAKIDEFNLTINLPMGWIIKKNKLEGKTTVEISNAGRRVMNIAEANPSVENLNILVKASSKSFKVLSQETITNGFGVTIQTKNRGQFLYYIQKDNKQYCFKSAAYYRNIDLNRCLEIIKSVK